MKFRLLQGFHVEGHPTREVGGTQRKDGNGEPIPGTGIKDDIRYKPGDVIETDKDLEHMFNQEGMPKKFERVGTFIPDGYQLSDSPKDGLDAMTLKELNSLAEAYEIDLKGNTKKDAVVTILRAYGVTSETVGV